ncbi:MAG: hypothetical protein DKM23_08870 [Candidatus Melainabacteria bacterium]|nr:MAG: hypothetical protein DKM23_08870 [Candidatus Melainabacteria bacterium]
MQLDKQILTAVESRGYLRKEIARVFQQANRRIQNVEKSGIVSPAVVALNKGNITGFTKFSMRHSWEDLKIEYSKAVSFLRQPTSTATGTKEYAEHLKKAYDLDDKSFALMQDKLMGKIASVSDERFLEQYLMQYKDFTGELEQESKDVSDQIEDDAVKIENALDDALEQIGNDPNAEAFINDVDSYNTDEPLKRILDEFKKFGL